MVLRFAGIVMEAYRTYHHRGWYKPHPGDELDHFLTLLIRFFYHRGWLLRWGGITYTYLKKRAVFTYTLCTYNRPMRVLLLYVPYTSATSGYVQLRVDNDRSTRPRKTKTNKKRLRGGGGSGGDRRDHDLFDEIVLLAEVATLACCGRPFILAGVEQGAIVQS